MSVVSSSGQGKLNRVPLTVIQLGIEPFHGGGCVLLLLRRQVLVLVLVLVLVV